MSAAVHVGQASATGYAVRSDGTAVNWGSDHLGELGNGSFAYNRQDRPYAGPVLQLTGVRAVAGGSNTGYALVTPGG